MESQKPFFFSLLVFLISWFSGSAHAQILVQSFDTLNSISQFKGTPPDLGQVDEINLKKYNNGSLPFYLAGERDKYLQINKSNNSQLRHFDRSTDINDESFLRISFDFSVDSTSAPGKFAGLIVGDSLTSFSQYPATKERWADIGIHVTDTNSFFLSNKLPGKNKDTVVTPAYSGEHRISVFLNNSGEDVSYLGPGDRWSTISDGMVVIWIDNRPILLSIAFKGESSAINAVKFLLWGGGLTALARIDDLVISDDINIDPLPVELLNFTAELQGSEVKLDWQTASEVNSSHFVVERSVDGMNFMSIGRREAAGTSQELKSYTFTDRETASALSPVLYYRLLQVDFDGASAYSTVIRVENPSAGKMLLSIHPNPFQDKLKIRLNSMAEQELHIRLLDSWGREILKESNEVIAAENGVSEIELRGLKHLDAGWYVLEVGAEGFLRQYRLIRQ